MSFLIALSKGFSHEVLMLFKYHPKRVVKYSWLVIGVSHCRLMQQHLDLDCHFLDLFRCYEN